MVARFLMVLFLSAAAVVSAQTVVSASPACPEFGRGWVAPPIRFAYDASAQSAPLKGAKSLTLHLLPLDMVGRGKEVDLPMTQDADGLWSATYSPAAHALGFYFVFSFEDGEHQIDDKSGDFYDLNTCYEGKLTSMAAQSQADTWTGQPMAPRFQRRTDLPRAIALLEEQLKLAPEDGNLYVTLWSDELQLGNYDSAAYTQFDRELNAAITAHATSYMFFWTLTNFVANNEEKLPAATVARYRQTVWDLPEKSEQLRCGPMMRPCANEPRDNYWVAEVARGAHDHMLSWLDLYAIRGEVDPKVRIDRYLAFEKEYPVPGIAGNGFIFASSTADKLGDAEIAARVFTAWTEWDPKNPDPYAWMGRFDVEHKVDLEKAVSILDESLALYKALNPGPTRATSSQPIKARAFTLVAPYSISNGKIEYVRGQAYLQLNRRKEACDDLSVAAKAMPSNKQVGPLLILACQENLGHAAP